MGNGNKAARSLSEKTRRMLPAHQMDAFAEQGLLPHTRTLYYPTPPKTAEEDGEVNIGATRIFIQGLKFLRTFFPGEQIQVILNTSGGNEYDGYAVYDAIRDPRYKNPITIEGYGQVMSMGVFILQAGHKRLLQPNTRLMIHYGTWSIGEQHSKDVDRTAKENKIMRKIYRDVLFKRIREKNPQFTKKKMEQILDFDHFFSAKEAVRLGLADEIIG